MNEPITIISFGAVVITTLAAVVKWAVGRLTASMDARVTALEGAVVASDKRHDECEKDRSALHARLVEVLQKR